MFAHIVQAFVPSAELLYLLIIGKIILCRDLHFPTASTIAHFVQLWGSRQHRPLQQGPQKAFGHEKLVILTSEE